MAQSKTQAVFRKIIAAGHYGYHEDFMCHAIDAAEQADTITSKEARLAHDAIEKYLDHIRDLRGWGGCVLSFGLAALGVPRRVGSQRDWAEQYGKAFYRAWDNRPKEAGQCAQ